jgi:hypothetical protein
MTKEELLQKGLSEEVADEVIAAFEAEKNPENSLQLLEKALNEGTPEEDLLKAKKDEENDDSGDEKEDDYNEEYMKKYMKRYMKANKKACGKMAKEVGLYGDDMKKAVEDIDADAEGAVIEMVDLKPFLDKQLLVNESMAKAIEDISGQVLSISAKQESTFDIMKKAANLQIDQAKSMGQYLSTPMGRKGKTSFTAKEMTKAQELTVDPNSIKKVYSVLMKATQNKDRRAGEIISKFESCKKDITQLSGPERKYIGELLTKEVN